MASSEEQESIKYSGAPRVSPDGREVFSFHLFRYLSAWLDTTGCRRVMVTIGFDDGQADLGAYRVDRGGVQAVKTGWTHGDLRDAWRYGSGRLVWEGPDGESIAFDVVAIPDGEEGPAAKKGSPAMLGFAMVQRAEGLDDEELAGLARAASEAIRVGRRNGVRLFFDEREDLRVKPLLYALMDRLPEWTGCDLSAAVLLTHDLDAITLEAAEGQRFTVLAERIFFEDQKTEEAIRLVGMAPETGRDSNSVLSDAFRRFQKDPDAGFFLYRRGDGPGAAWKYGGHSEELQRWYEVEGRPQGETTLLLPLVHQTRGDRDFLGFLSLAWKESFEIPPSVQQMLRGLGEQIGRLLSQSSLFSMSVRKMWVHHRVRQVIEEAIAGSRTGTEALEETIGKVSDLVAEHVGVPSFAIGYLRKSGDSRKLRYVHPQGWTHYDDLELAVDVDGEECVDSGVSALAVRLKRPVVLAGGYREGDSQEFKNFLWVDEETGRLIDARSPQWSVEELQERFRPLADYYKPARKSAYATLAYPMVFSKALEGVLTVEVDKGTDWFWWTGFGGHLFWQVVAREVALAVSVLGK